MDGDKVSLEYKKVGIYWGKWQRPELQSDLAVWMTGVGHTAVT